jgi:hypothetical protein
MVPKTETAFKSEGRRNSFQELPSNHQTAQTGNAETVSALLAQFAPYADGKGYAMNNDYQDVAGNVINRLAVLSHMFEFYQFTKDMANFRQETFPGLCLIIDDCIDELKTIV